MDAMDLISAALDATARAGRPEVVSEQHDTGRINWVAGMSDPGEMIGCGMYQELRRLAGEADDAYQARLTAILPTIPAADRLKIEVAMKAAAVRRAGLDTSNGRIAVMVAGQPAWHGLGVNVREAVSSADAIRLAGLDWLVDKVRLKYLNPVTGLMADSPGQFGIVRQDTGAMLGAVGSVYQPFQNAEGFDFLDGVIGEFGARYESAGSLYGGSKVWMMVHLPRQAFAVNGSDRVEPYAIFTNAHDGSAAARCFPTSHRVVCANTFRLAAAADAGRGMVIRHTGNLRARVACAQKALGMAVRGVESFKTHAEVLARTPVTPVPYFEGLLDVVCQVTAADAAKGADALAAVLAVTDAERKVEAARLQREIDKRKTLLDDLLERYEGEKNGVAGMRGTGWAAFNAVTESADHGALAGRHVGKDKASRRFESVLDGTADGVKQVAYEQVLQLLAN